MKRRRSSENANNSSFVISVGNRGERRAHGGGKECEERHLGDGEIDGEDHRQSTDPHQAHTHPLRGPFVVPWAQFRSGRDSGEALPVLPHGGQRGVHAARSRHDAEEGARDAVWRVLGLRREVVHPRQVSGDAPAGNELRLRRPEERARRPSRCGATPLDRGAHLAVAAREGGHAEGWSCASRRWARRSRAW